MERTRLPYRLWAIAMYLFTTNLKGVSSMKLHRELGITQKSAWFMLHRLRKAAEASNGAFAGPVECDETYMGGKRANMSNAKRKEPAGTGRGAVGKTAVVGAKDRATKQVRAQVVADTDKPTLQRFVVEHTAPDATESYTPMRLPSTMGCPCLMNPSSTLPASMCAVRCIRTESSPSGAC